MRVRVPPSAQLIMITFFHQFAPQAVFFSFYWIKIYWYGFLIVIGIISAMAVSRFLWKKKFSNLKLFDDLSFWLVVSGLIGARVYEWFLNFNYYFSNPEELLKIWHGGLAIHGAIIGALIALIIFSKKHKIKASKIIAVVVPGLALGQAIGRWGNYFNQELFGLPTNLPWGIFISPENRPLDYFQFSYFQPTFFYESLLCLLLFFVLLIAQRKKAKELIIIAIYFLGYGLIRFFLEFIKIDSTPQLLGLRWPQIISLLFIIIGGILIYRSSKEKTHD